MFIISDYLKLNEITTWENIENKKLTLRKMRGTWDCSLDTLASFSTKDDNEHPKMLPSVRVEGNYL